MSRADYAPTSQVADSGARVASLDPKGAAARAGLLLDDVLLSVDGHRLRDVLDWQWHTEGLSAELMVRKSDGSERRATLVRESSEGWGLDFADALFDGVHTCRNNCAFCFMAQLPAGMRSALYLRDDDYRLSFLQGNFITLTNLSDSDVERIAEQRLSPLYISLHAVEQEVRSRLVCAQVDHALERFDELLGAGIDLHVQIVLVPGVNDGEQLEHTLTWLAEREGVQSVGIVPLGYTRHQERFACSYTEPVAAAEVIQQCQRWQFAMKERDNISWVHLADEFYLNARAPLPTAEWYDDFPQYENGIGIVRTFVDDATVRLEMLKCAVDRLPTDAEAVTVITSTMAATTLVGALTAAEAIGRVRLLVVPNAFFGGNVSVTGLLVGRDLVEAMVRDASSGIYLLPDIVFNADGLTLDDYTLADLEKQSGARIRLVSSDAAGLLAGLEHAATEISTNH